MKIPRLTLVGAGPGDPELITIKALKAMETADVILYDALVNPDILKHASTDALKIYVGKRNNHHTFTQDQINSMLVDFAFLHGHVVRLKGGYPFVFGRGHEELVYAESFNIPITVIPGLSSCIAVPELQGIPVTHRGTSESFWVITGTTSTGKLSADIQLAAQSTATVVILMGLNKLKEITDLFKLHGKHDTAVAVIQNGSLVTEKIALGTVDTIVEVIKNEQIDAPAVIVIGDVVKLHAAFPLSLTNWEYLFN
jgi:uroporphyrin-III C-methyltransferase